MPPKAIILIGDNGQGKSNLLEAIYYLATTRSWRAQSDRELIDWRATEEQPVFARIAGQFVRQRDTIRVEVVLQEEQAQSGNGAGRVVSKRIRINGAPKRAIDLVGQVQVVMFSPQDIDLVLGPPQGRRRYLDVTLSLLDARYLRSLSHYNRVLTQRNHLLRQIREGAARLSQLTFWDEELTAAGAYLLQRRLEVLSVLRERAGPVHRRLTDGQEELRFEYRSSLAGLTDLADRDAATIRQQFGAELSALREREVRSGMSLLGPHRDDFAFVVNDRDLAAFGSRGQQRTAVLSLRLAETELVQEWSGEPPILLLDDVMSELDAPRRHQVREAVARSPQAIISATDPGAFEAEFLASALRLRVSAGTIAPIESDE
ncbi:MAG: DNA replication/repair protein RecF [Chloroflexi bacterium]|nr:DNA replication/repair protein RecF [Chloroflexota bacterium]MCL5026432.1 DNA replication/repair protein RecF [Chloroflexota bacterium]